MTDETDETRWAYKPGLRQEAPFPTELDELVKGLSYRPGWKFFLKHNDRGQGSVGLTLMVLSQGYDSYHPEKGETYRVWHYFPVPPAAYNRESWTRWLLDRLIEIETHEACEFMVIDGRRPFAPVHAPGYDPYMVTTVVTDEARRTSFRGDIKEPDRGTEAGQS